VAELLEVGRLRAAGSVFVDLSSVAGQVIVHIPYVTHQSTRLPGDVGVQRLSSLRYLCWRWRADAQRFRDGRPSPKHRRLMPKSGVADLPLIGSPGWCGSR
jgi:hypothetical protein